MYLLTIKWLWKQNVKEDYDFTLKELREALGYSGTNNEEQGSKISQVREIVTKYLKHDTLYK